MSTISTSGIAPSSVIRAEHVLRVINALSNVANNDILITGSLTITGSTAVSGSLNVAGGITGSMFGTATNATSASYALTSSYAISASYEINYETSSSYANEATTASYALTSSYAISSTSASYALSSSYALNSTNAVSATSASYALNSTNAASATSASYSAVAQTLLGSVVSSSYALTASYALNSPGGGGTTNTGSLLLTASATDNVITFTKGDASTFNITVNTGSASSINTGSFATTGSNTFNGNQIITGSVSISGSQNITGSLSVDSGTIINSDAFSIMRIYPNFINIENQGSPFDNTLLSLGVLSHNSASNSQQLLFPASLSTGIKAITLPNDTGTVALTYNTATTGSNTFKGNQIVNANLTLTSSATMSISTVTGNLGMSITNDQILINPNLNLDRTTLSGGDLQLSAVDGYSGLYLTNRNGSNNTGSIEIHRMQFYGKSTDTYNGLKAGLRVYQSTGTGSLGSFNFYTSASSAFGFNTGDLDMRISTGSKIELFRNTTVTGSVSITSVLTLTPNNPLPTSQPTGSISVSGSGADCKPYFYNGTDWTSMI